MSKKYMRVQKKERPNFHPFDLMVGIAFGIGMKVVVYVRGKNAKKYGHGAE